MTTGAVSPSLYFGWRNALVALAGVIAALIALYFDTASGMVDIWARSGTFTHAFLVPPITLWLIWERHQELAELDPYPDWRWLIPMALIGIGWLLGDLAAVNAVTQTAFTALLVCAVPLVIGTTASARIAFPLGFLFFAVPIGEFVMPKLMDWTATVTVIGLRASGIPVYQEGLHFVIPSGRWSVIEACSGVRYLIASLCVGTLFAYLNYRSWIRRAVFVAFAIAVPVVANWVRAYGIVMMGHLSGNELAVGVDHLIYGWLFFGVVISVMFAIGLRWREDVDPPAAPLSTAVERDTSRSGMRTILAAIAGVVVLAVPPIVVWVLDSAQPLPQAKLNAQLLVRDGWAQSDRPLPAWQPAYANPSATQSIILENADKRVGVFVAFYEQQGYARKLISSDNKLVKSEDESWVQVARGTQPVNIGGTQTVVRTGKLRAVGVPDAEAARLTVWYWHRIRGQDTINDPLGKVRLAIAKLTGQSDVSAAVFVYALDRDAGAANDYLAQAGQAIGAMVDQAAVR